MSDRNFKPIISPVRVLLLTGNSLRGQYPGLNRKLIFPVGPSSSKGQIRPG